MYNNQRLEDHVNITCFVDPIHDCMDACRCCETIAVTIGEDGLDSMLRWWRSGGSRGGTDGGETNRSFPAVG